MLKTRPLDQIHIRAVMLCMSKTSKMSAITGVCMLKMSKIDQIHMGSNAMYVEDVEDGKTSHNRCLLKYARFLDQIHI